MGDQGQRTGAPESERPDGQTDMLLERAEILCGQFEAHFNFVKDELIPVADRRVKRDDARCRRELDRTEQGRAELARLDDRAKRANHQRWFQSQDMSNGYEAYSVNFAQLETLEEMGNLLDQLLGYCDRLQQVDEELLISEWQRAYGDGEVEGAEEPASGLPNIFRQYVEDPGELFTGVGMFLQNEADWEVVDETYRRVAGDEGRTAVVRMVIQLVAGLYRHRPLA